MLKRVPREEVQVVHLPGRDWLLYAGPDNVGAQNLMVGYSVFPPGSAPPGHVHPAQEEIIFCVAGRGELVGPDGAVTLEPGTAVYVPVGVHHATVSLGPGNLELVTSFSPPVAPGSWDKKVE